VFLCSRSKLRVRTRYQLDTARTEKRRFEPPCGRGNRSVPCSVYPQQDCPCTPMQRGSPGMPLEGRRGRPHRRRSEGRLAPVAPRAAGWSAFPCLPRRSHQYACGERAGAPSLGAAPMNPSRIGFISVRVRAQRGVRSMGAAVSAIGVSPKALAGLWLAIAFQFDAHHGRR
jgi:hypothetical protein